MACWVGFIGATTIKNPESLITSLQHPLVKHLVRLREERSYRREHGSVLIAGCKLTEELCHSYPLITLMVEENYPLPPDISAKNIYRVPIELLKKVTGLSQPEPLAAEIPLPPVRPIDPKYPLLILDQLADPGNVGTLLRTALALGWNNVFCTPHTADPFNAKALRAARGATFHLNLREDSHEALIDLIKEQQRTLFIATVGGSLLSTGAKPIALVLGNESHGIHPTLQYPGIPISIPIASEVESLNVAIAGAILMHHFRGVS